MANTTADKLAKLSSTKAALKSAINGSGSTVGDVFADYPIAVSNGRAGIAAAITEKGVQTSADAPFDVLVANVRAIETGVPIETVKITLITTGPFTVYYLNEKMEVKEEFLPSSITVIKNSIFSFSALARNPSSGATVLLSYGDSGGGCSSVIANSDASIAVGA